MNKSLLALAILSALAGLAMAKKPNILFIFTDDQRADTIGVLGNPDIKTPNIDKLAERSKVFNNGYCYGAHTGAVCIASRNQVMTGKVWHRWAPKMRCPSSGDTLPKVMKTAGYETFYREKSAWANHPVIGKQFDHYGEVHNVNALMSGRACRPFVDDALKFLKQTRNKDKPFFIYLGVSGPHDPRYAEKHFRDMYDPAKIPLPKNFKPMHHWDIGSMTIRDERLEAWPRGKEATRGHIFDYYALMTAMDYDLGRLLDYLKQSGLEKETIIIYSSDHGLALGSHGLFGKQNIYEVGMKVPFMVAGPGIDAGKTDALVYLHDVFPTVVDFAGGKIADKIDGKSIRPVLEGKSAKVRDVATLAYQDSQRSIRDERWKLMVFPQINRHQLFDLKNDPDEMHDVSAENPERVARMMDLLKAQQQQYGDAQALRVDKPQPADFKTPKVKPYPRARAGGESKKRTLPYTIPQNT
ncbi:sulfatase-like hydrolase/transferase [Verrucomicrobiaceae bacterium N1E253]|uniref:Sulfatase-like hydrolase/transferase n=1 Tax=Oceaniferula marina TaxID=2748318 RepID=A0A851GEG1_9BACT|nr:sulfatase-like hydrolase/transferase [Oceaniferula marina]NWK55933.1 sulfatase-like hydrolase/transferase [Oceaniferula marina]